MGNFFTKLLIDLIPSLLFSFATIVFININNVLGFIMLIIAFASLDLHTYLINKYNLNK